MGSIGNSTISAPSIREEPVKGLIFGQARISSSWIDIDGYSNKATEKGALQELARAVEKYDENEAEGIRNMIKFNEIEQTPARKDEGGAQYILEWEDVPSATRYVNDDEMEEKPARRYMHIRILK